MLAHEIDVLSAPTVSNDSWSFSQNLDVSWDPLSNTVFLGTPCQHTIHDMYNSASVDPEYVMLTGIKWATLVSLATITQIES
jgi:hypothetical protein